MLVSGAGRDELAAAGVGWVVVESGHAPALALPVAYRDDDLTVYQVGGDAPPASHRAVMVSAHAVWLAQLLLGLVAMTVGRVRSRQADRREQKVHGPQGGDE